LAELVPWNTSVQGVADAKRFHGVVNEVNVADDLVNGSWHKPSKRSRDHDHRADDQALQEALHFLPVLFRVTALRLASDYRFVGIQRPARIVNPAHKR
jgi:hypothetical protein